MQLLIRLAFPERRYHGRLSEDQLEYPPAPARLFQSLIAATHVGAYSLRHTELRDKALRWLESLSPPVIEAPAVRETGDNVINYVPNNDDGGKDSPLVHKRTARSFLTSAFPGEAKLCYRWNFEPTRESCEAATTICAMTGLMTHLGQHQDIVYAYGEVLDESDQADSDRLYMPFERQDGHLTAPMSGSLDAYRERYNRVIGGKSKEDVTVPLRRVDYQRSQTVSLEYPLALFELWRNEDERLRFDPRDLLQPAAMTRHAMIEWLAKHPDIAGFYGESYVSRMVSGHENGGDAAGPHLACVPIPSLDDRGVADGLIRRVLLVGLGCNDDHSRELFESVVGGIAGAPLKDRDREIGYLKPAPINDTVLSLFRARPRRVWRTVTPIILTGMMRPGRGAESLILRALRQSGIDEGHIDSIAAFKGPIVPKTLHPLDYRVAPRNYLAETPRFHAEVIFNRPVRGLLVAGRGRHYGFGLMIPCREE